MTLIEVHVTIDDRASLPPAVTALLDRAEDAIERVHQLNGAITGFITSDYDACWRTIAAVRDQLRPGDVFCEWGCGLGVVVGLASIAGFEACGIEIEPPLIDAGIELMEDAELDVALIAGSFVPSESSITDLLDSEGSMGMRSDGRSAYDELGMDIDELDVIFIFPWPGEQHAAMQLFDTHAAPGSILLINLGIDGIGIYRKQ